MNRPTASDTALFAVGAMLLAQGRTLDRLSRALTVTVLVALLVLSIVERPPAVVQAVLTLVALAGLVETWLALRVAFDAALFRALAEGQEPKDLAGLDAALLGLGLLPAAKAGRPALARLAGARRLLRLQALALGAQIALAVLGALLIARR